MHPTTESRGPRPGGQRSEVRMGRSMRGVFALGAALLLGAWTPPADSPVADAAMRGDTARVRVLIKSGADVNGAQGDGMTALHWAATRGDAAEVAMLVYAGARVEALTRNGNYTPCTWPPAVAGPPR